MRPKRRNVAQLESKLVQVQAWIDERSGKIKQALAQRNAALSVLADRAKDHDTAAALTRREADDCHAKACEALKKAEDLQAQANVFLESEERLRASVEEFEGRASNVRLEAKQAKREWHVHMRSFLQAGKYRRYCRDKAKLRRRLETKRKDAEKYAGLEPLTAEEIAMGVTVNEKMKQAETR
jgi:hypothetical protein